MKILICGAGVSGIFLSLFLKKRNPSFDVVLFDKNEIIGKKLLITGNGKCNIGNNVINEYSYNDSFLNDKVKEFITKEKELLESLGIYLRENNNYLYPYSFSSRTLNNYLLDLIKFYNIELHLNEQIIDYDKKCLFTNKSKYKYDKLIFSMGGNSYKNTGSNGFIYELLNKHGYKINNLYPGLCPIKVKENLSILENSRFKCISKLYDENDSLIYEEEGEVIFKKNALSGICIFNISSFISRKKIKNPIIKLDLFPHYKIEDLYKKFENNCNLYKESFLKSILGKNMFIYLSKNGYKDLKEFLFKSKNLKFTFDSLYSFSESQVTIGGLSLNEVNESFESIKESNTYIIGESLDVDGLCGGYNILFAIYSAYKVLESIDQSL